MSRTNSKTVCQEAVEKMWKLRLQGAWGNVVQNTEGIRMLTGNGKNKKVASPGGVGNVSCPGPVGKMFCQGAIKN